MAGVGVVESYHYLGLGTIVQRDQPQINERLTYIRRPTDAAAAGNDRYSGLDRFGRVIDQNWVRTAASAGGAAGTSSVRLQHQYDRAGNALSRLDLVDAALSELYQYDDLDRLTSFQRGVPSDPPTLQQSWDLDALGNWSGVTTGGATTNRQFNVGNQTTSVSGGTAPTYDTNGNVATKDGMEYKYDAWGRLASMKAVGGSVLAQYTHDALGRRAVEKYPGVFTTHVYFTPDWSVIEERTDATTHLTVLGATGQIILRDVYSGGAPNEDWRYYPRQNANGDIVALVKGAAPNAGRVLERYAYEPYGAMVVMAGDGTPRPGGTAYSWRVFFQGGRIDNLSGLYNFQRRDYDPSSGVWTTRDPIGLDGGDRNLYRFVGNNPVNWVDPSGLAPNISFGPVAAPPGGGVSRPNLPRPLIDYLPTIGSYPSKCNQLRIPSFEPWVPTSSRCRIPVLRPGDPAFSKRGPGMDRIPVTGGNGYVGAIPSNTTVGITGAGPCVGLILIPENMSVDPVYVFHFTANDSPGRTLWRESLYICPPKLLNKPAYPLCDKGYKAIINGGNTVEGGQEALRTLYTTIRACQQERIPITGYVPAPDVDIDANGNIYWTTPSSISLIGYEP